MSDITPSQSSKCAIENPSPIIDVLSETSVQSNLRERRHRRGEGGGARGVAAQVAQLRDAGVQGVLSMISIYLNTFVTQVYRVFWSCAGTTYYG